MENNSKNLRELAKDELRRGKKIDASLYENDLKVLVEELSIYQIELEHQNQELIHSQELLQQSKDRYFDLFDNAPIGYLIVNSEGIIKDINKAACLLLGSDKNEFIENKITKIIHPDFQDVYYIFFKSLINHKHNQTFDIKLRKSNNTFFYARIQGIRESQLITYDPEFRLAIIDVTIQKEMELKLLTAKEHAEESDRLKSAFLANMSHEIRTPMNGILGFAELLKEPGLSGDEYYNYIKIIEKSGAYLLNIINDIVDISKIEAGLMKTIIVESNINDQIEYIYNFFKPEVDAKGIILIFNNFLPSDEAVIKTDREKVYAILTNLVKNAIKYTNEGSIEFGYTKRDNYLEFYVKDTGIGIPKLRQEAIFERFIQADNEDIKSRQGAGLGLAITKSYIEMLGGKIWLESEVGIGSTFYFTLPYNMGVI
jgi:PAS domain S-box-containing protein